MLKKKESSYLTLCFASVIRKRTLLYNLLKSFFHCFLVYASRFRFKRYASKAVGLGKFNIEAPLPWLRNLFTHLGNGTVVVHVIHSKCKLQLLFQTVRKLRRSLSLLVLYGTKHCQCLHELLEVNLFVNDINEKRVYNSLS